MRDEQRRDAVLTADARQQRRDRPLAREVEAVERLVEDQQPGALHERLGDQQPLDALRAQGRPIGRASVYRVLELLTEHRLVERLAIDQGHARFERIEPDGHHHHHLLCDSCGRLVAFDDPGLERAIDRLSSRLGVRVEHHDVLLHGACAACG